MEVYSNTSQLQETRNISNKQPNLTPKAIRERRTKTSKDSRRKEIRNIRSEINEKEMKEMTAKINKTKSCFFENINKIDKPSAITAALFTIARTWKQQIGRASCRERV